MGAAADAAAAEAFGFGLTSKFPMLPELLLLLLILLLLSALLAVGPTAAFPSPVVFKNLDTWRFNET
jgi:hypothetical protein